MLFLTDLPITGLKGCDGFFPPFVLPPAEIVNWVYNRPMHWIYLSPHFDDAVLSCGGMIWEQVHSGETVEIWTLCAGQIPKGLPLTAFAEQKHRDWKVDLRVVNRRRAEDRAACAFLGAAPRHWTLPDIIYRRLPNGDALVNDGADLWLPVHPGELRLAQRLRAWLRRNLPTEAQLVCPLTLGNHTDHRLVRACRRKPAPPPVLLRRLSLHCQPVQPVPNGVCNQRAVHPRRLAHRASRLAKQHRRLRVPGGRPVRQHGSHARKDRRILANRRRQLPLARRFIAA